MIKRAKLFIINPTEYISSYDKLTQLLTKTAVSLSPQRKKDASYCKYLEIIKHKCFF